MLHHFLNRRQAVFPPALSSLFEHSLFLTLTKHRGLPLELPTWIRTHEHMPLNCLTILSRVFRGAAHCRRESSAILFWLIERFAKRGRPIATSACAGFGPSLSPYLSQVLHRCTLRSVSASLPSPPLSHPPPRFRRRPAHYVLIWMKKRTRSMLASAVEHRPQPCLLGPEPNPKSGPAQPGRPHVFRRDKT